MGSEAGGKCVLLGCRAKAERGQRETTQAASQFPAVTLREAQRRSAETQAASSWLPVTAALISGRQERNRYTKPLLLHHPQRLQPSPHTGCCSLALPGAVEVSSMPTEHLAFG